MVNRSWDGEERWLAICGRFTRLIDFITRNSRGNQTDSRILHTRIQQTCHGLLPLLHTDHSLPVAGLERRVQAPETDWILTSFYTIRRWVGADSWSVVLQALSTWQIAQQWVDSSVLTDLFTMTGVRTCYEPLLTLVALCLGWLNGEGAFQRKNNSEVGMN